MVIFDLNRHATGSEGFRATDQFPFGMDKTASSASKQHVLIEQMRRLMVSSRQTEKLADLFFVCLAC